MPGRAQFSISFGIQQPSCHEGKDGQLTANPLGGTAPYTFEWSTGQQTATIAGLVSDLYSVTVTDANDQIKTASVFLPAPEPISGAFELNNCNLPITIKVTGSGGNGPYQYRWGKGKDGDTITVFEPGKYCVTIIDANFCARAECVKIEPTKLSVALTPGPPVCDGESDGTATVEVSNGIAPISYLWSNGDTSSTITGLIPGPYSVTVTDSSGCTATGETIVPSARSVEITGTIQEPSCDNASNGSIDITINQGAAPYTFEWSNGATTEDIDNLTPGSYRLTVTDANGCNAVATYEVSTGPAIELGIEVINASCEGSAIAFPIIDGGTPPYGYQWSTGDSTSLIDGLSTGPLSLTLTDAQGCTAEAFTTITLDDSLDVDFELTEILCPEEATGAIEAAVAGGLPPYHFRWNTGDTTALIDDLEAGIYNLTVSDQNGCSQVLTVELPAPPSFTVDFANVSNNLCDGANEGAATALVNGGTGPFTFEWSNDSTGVSISNLSAGTYSITVTDNNGCTAENSIIISSAPEISVEIAADESICGDQNSASAQAIVTGGRTPFEYLWNTGDTTAIIENIDSGSYSLTVTDANGCTAEANIDIVTSTAIEVFFQTTPVSCFGLADGSIITEITGGNSPYSLLWDTGDTTRNLQGLAGGFYDLTVTDANGCTVEVNAEVVEPEPFFVDFVNVITGICPGSNDGAATALVSGGSRPYTFLWSNGNTGVSVNNLEAGVYAVTATDAQGCSAENMIIISEVPELSIDIRSSTTVCDEDGFGDAQAEVSGGRAPYTYSWNTGDTTAEIDSLPTGTYLLTVTDANGCSNIDSITIDVSAPVELELSGMPINCAGDSSGTAAVVASGGLAPYRYLWNTGDTTSSLENLPAGTYRITVTDANGCTANSEIVFNENTPLSIDFINVVDTICAGSMDGAATAQVNGGIAPYSYSWSTGDDTPSIAGLAAGPHFVTVTDVLGCTFTDTLLIFEADSLDVTINASDILCSSGNLGAAFAEVAGGIAPYNYLWSTGATTPSIDSLDAGVYNITVTDINGCAGTAQVSISVTDDIIVDINIGLVDCFEAPTGSAEALVSGGTAPYRYTWSSGDTTAAVDSLLAGNYGLTVSDANGCEGSVAFAIDEPAPVILRLENIIDTVCNQASTGRATVVAGGGLAPYSFLWSNGDENASTENLPAGDYAVTVTDANGCEAVTDLEIEERPELSVFLNTTGSVCPPDTLGEITISVVNGRAPFDYLWSNDSTTATVTGLTTGDYSVTVTDANGCMGTQSTTIEVFDSLNISVDVENILCAGDESGAATVSVANGNGPFEYLWSNGATTPQVNGLAAGSYAVTVTAPSGCFEITDLIIFENAALDIRFFSLIDTICPDQNIGQAEAAASGGQAPYTFEWSNGLSGALNQNLTVGTYLVTVTDMNGCQAVDSVEIVASDPISLGIENIQETCELFTNGALRVQVEGGTMPYTYAWSNGDNTATINNLAIGTYTVTVTDAGGCSATISGTIDGFPPLSCTINILEPETTPGAGDGSAEVIVSGGTAPFTYQWSDGQTTPIGSELTDGNYSVTVTDANGCTTNCQISFLSVTRVGDLVWEDFNRNGLKDPNEPGIPNVPVIIEGIMNHADTNNTTSFKDSTTTNSLGQYQFDIPPGKYQLRFIPPRGFVGTIVDAGDDEIDSDMDPNTFTTSVYTFSQGELNNSVDAGFHEACINVMDGGEIASDQSFCGPGQKAAPFVELNPVSGGFGPVEYKWMKNTVSAAINHDGWELIDGATSSSYEAGLIFETTHFARFARREGCETFVPSNTVSAVVTDSVKAGIYGPLTVCQDEPVTFTTDATADPFNVRWQFGGPVYPNQVIGTTAVVNYGEHGEYEVQLYVTQNGCPAFNKVKVNVIQTPGLCETDLVMNTTVTEQEDVLVEWQIANDRIATIFDLEYSKDGESFELLKTIEEPDMVASGQRYFSYKHILPKKGHNYYRIRVYEKNKEWEYYSSTEEVIIFGDSKLLLVYPNPVWEDELHIELFEDLEENLLIRLFAIDGVLLQQRRLLDPVKKLTLDMSSYLPGTYFLTVQFGKTLTKQYKVIRY